MTFFNDKKAGDPEWIAGDEEHEAALAESGISVEAACRIPGRPVRWLVENVIPDAAVTVIAGEPGAGKTFFACQLAADAARVSQCRVVLAASGYEAPELLRWRLDQAGADTRRIVLATLSPDGFKDRRGGPNGETIDERMAVLYHTLQRTGDPTSGVLPSEGSGVGVQGSAGEKADGKRQTAEGGSGFRIQDSDADSQCKMQIEKCKLQNGASGSSDEELSPKIQDLRPKTSEDFPPFPSLRKAAELLVIDDVDGWFGKPGQCVSAAALACVIQRLNELARSLRVAIVVLVRAQMSAEGRLTSRQLSRLAQSASVVWMVVRDREQGTGQREESESPRSKVQSPKSENEARAYSQSVRRWLLPVKNNLAPDAATFGRAFELLDGQIRWHRDDPAPSLAEATLPSAYGSDRRRLRHAAAVWLEEALAAGPLPSRELYRQGLENGFSQATLKRAATELGIVPHKTGFNGGWEMRWTPPPDTPRSEPALGSHGGFRIVGAEDEEEKAQGGRQKAKEESQNAKYKSQNAKGDAGDAAAAAGVERSAVQSCAASEMNCASSEKSGDLSSESCASSKNRGGSLRASCASSPELENLTIAGRPHPGPLPAGEGESSCASSKNRGGSLRASCASSPELENLTIAGRPHPGPLPAGEGESSCASSEERGDSSMRGCSPSGIREAS